LMTETLSDKFILTALYLLRKYLGQREIKVNKPIWFVLGALRHRNPMKRWLYAETFEYIQTQRENELRNGYARPQTNGFKQLAEILEEYKHRLKEAE